MSGPLAEDSAAGHVVHFDHIDAEDYRAARWLSERPLEVPDVAALLTAVKDAVDDRGLLLPDAEVLVERIVVGLLEGHVILAGPPGTGKTTLAGIVAEAFGASYDTETATADWSTFDVIGGLQPAVGLHGTEVLKPWLGHVPRAALRCADRIVLHDDDAAQNPEQAHWLVIDEFNRAEIDKAVGPLYTVLGGGGADERRKLPLWFGDKPETQECWIPDRFRILGTLNSVDTAYVYSLSQGLQRRFQFVHVGVPAQTQLEAETETVIEQAVGWWLTTYRPDLSEADRASEHQKLIGDSELAKTLQRLRDLVEHLRYDADVEWPVGTAQLVDIVRQVVVRAVSGGTSALLDGLDLAVSDRLLPQASALSRAQLERISSWLGEYGDWPRSQRALQRVRHSQQTSFG